MSIFSQKDGQRLRLEKGLEELFSILDQIETNLVTFEFMQKG